MEASVRDITHLCQCASCGDELEEPIILPCIHRFCKKCLSEQLTEQTDVIQCPRCTHMHDMSSNGVNFYQTDYHIEQLLECLKVDRLLRREEKRGKCGDCLKERDLTSYCFKCHATMCDECLQYHVTATSLRTHREHVKKLHDLEKGNIDLKALTAMTVAPACPHHPEKDLEHWCVTCQNMVICQTCACGFHRDHVIESVSSEFEAKKASLKECTRALEKGKTEIYNLAKKVDKSQNDTDVSISREENKLRRQHEELLSSIMQERQDVIEAYSITKKNLKEKYEKKLEEIRAKMDAEVAAIKEKYQGIFEEMERKIENDLSRLATSQEKHMHKLDKEKRDLEVNCETLKETLASSKKERTDKIDRVSRHIDCTTARYENLSATIQNIETIEQWAASSTKRENCAHLLNIPRICSFAATVGRDMIKQFPGLDGLGAVSIPKLTCHCAQKDVPIIATGTNVTIEVGWSKSRDWEVNDICGDGTGNIVISGHRSHESHVTSCGIKGEQLQQYTKLDSQCLAPFRYCSNLTNRRVATVCHPCEIGIFNLMTSSYHSENIRDQIKEHWHAERGVGCVAADLPRNEIYVGLMGSRDVAVFSDKLRYLRSVSLMYCGNYGPDGLAIRGDTLIVCDYYKSNAFVSDIQGNLKHQLDKPVSSKAAWRPSRACLDQQGCIYILWKVEFSSERAILQYCSDGRHVLSEVMVDEDGESVTTILVDGVEKILLATSSTGKIITYEQIHHV